MKNLPLIALIFFFVLGCNQTANVNRGGNTQTITTQQSTERRISLNKKMVCSGLEVSLGEIAIEKGKVTLGMTIRSTAKDVLTFYPNQKYLVIGNTQLDANMFMGEGDVSGEIQSGVEKSASIVYLDTENKINPAEVKQIKFYFGDVFNKKSYKATPCETSADIN